MNTHPDWLAVGATVIEVRALGRSVAWRQRRTVTRHTRTLVVLDNGSRYRRKRHGYNSDRYELTPAYLDYQTWLEPAP